MSAFDKLIDRNKSITNRAYAMLDKIGNAWRDAEEFLRSQGVLRGVEVALRPIKDQQTGREIGEECIGVQKLNGAWRICVGDRFHEVPDCDRNWKPVVDAPVHVRIGMIEHLRDLFEAVVKSNEACADEIEDAVKKMDDMLSGMQGRRPESE